MIDTGSSGKIKAWTSENRLSNTLPICDGGDGW